MSDIRILGARLGQMIGREVILLGKMTEKSPNGTSIELTTTDGVIINVTLPETLDHTATDYIEVRGVMKSKSTLLCKSFICFPPDMTDTFDAEKYNNMVQTRHIMGNKLDEVFHG